MFACLHTHTHTHTYIYIYIEMHLTQIHTHTHTHTHICVGVGGWVGGWVGMHMRVFTILLKYQFIRGFFSVCLSKYLTGAFLRLSPLLLHDSRLNASLAK